MEAGDSFLALSKFVRGKIDVYTLQYSDPLISRVVLDRENLAQSYVFLDFEDEEKFLKILNVPDEDIYFYQAINSPYGNYEIVDYQLVDEDFQEGYGIWHFLDDENTNLLENISKLIHPKKFDLDDREFKHELAVKLEKYYPREVNDMLTDYVNERNREMIQSAVEYIQKEINRVLNSFGFEFVSSDTIKAKVGDLINLYFQYNLPHLSLSKMVKNVFKSLSYPQDLGGWEENRWEFGNDRYFDEESINRTINRNLTKIYDNLTENFENSPDTKKFFEFITKITKQYKVGQKYKLPKNPKYFFRINDFDKDELKINIILFKPNKDYKKLGITEPNFYNLLYQPELFDLSEL